MYYAFRDGERFVERLRQVLPLEPSLKESLFYELKTITQAVLYGQVMTAVIQGGLGALGLLIFGVPNWLFWGAIMMLTAFIPLLGTPIVWGPAALSLILGGSTARGVGLLIYGGVLVMNIDNFLRPRLMSGRTKVHPGVDPDRSPGRPSGFWFRRLAGWTAGSRLACRLSQVLRGSLRGPVGSSGRRLAFLSASAFFFLTQLRENQPDRFRNADRTGVDRLCGLGVKRRAQRQDRSQFRHRRGAFRHRSRVALTEHPLPVILWRGLEPNGMCPAFEQLPRFRIGDVSRPSQSPSRRFAPAASGESRTPDACSTPRHGEKRVRLTTDSPVSRPARPVPASASRDVSPALFLPSTCRLPQADERHDGLMFLFRRQQRRQRRIKSARHVRQPRDGDIAFRIPGPTEISTKLPIARRSRAASSPCWCVALE